MLHRGKHVTHPRDCMLHIRMQKKYIFPYRAKITNQSLLQSNNNNNNKIFNLYSAFLTLKAVKVNTDPSLTEPD